MLIMHDQKKTLPLIKNIYLQFPIKQGVLKSGPALTGEYQFGTANLFTIDSLLTSVDNLGYGLSGVMKYQFGAKR
jgi:hypothetical protein